MALRLAELYDTSLDTEGSLLGADCAQPAACGAGLFFAQLLPLLRSCFLQGAGGQALGRGASHFFHLGEIDIQAGSLLAERAPHNNFSPLSGQIGDRLQFFG